MLKFNNDHIFTGYIKQLLSSINLPTYKVYTKELAKYKEKYGKESPEIIETVTTDTYTYKNHIRYVPYIKDGYLMEYVFTEDASSTNAEDATGSCAWKNIGSYYPNKNGLNCTKTLRVNNNIYDSYTHEYLGDFLRFVRDYQQLNLMPLYNCFSNRICQNLYIECVHPSGEGTNKKHFLFNSADKHYKIYMLPVKLFKEYTIAIDCEAEVEVCCGLYGKYQDNSTDLSNIIPHETYKHYAQLHFNQPVLYSPLKNLSSFLEKDSVVELSTREKDLKLFIKLPADNTSSITILEGNYLGYNDRFTHHKIVETDTGGKVDKLVESKNHTITNMEGKTGEVLTESEYLSTINFKPITYLQLLAANTGTSYPFADRLIEYLLENVVTHIDPVSDNIERVQTVVAGATNNNVTTNMLGIWDARIQPILYNFMQTDKKVSQEVNHDIFGYADKDTEQLFSGMVWNENKGRYIKTSIANIDLYPDIYLEAKVEIN